MEAARSFKTMVSYHIMTKHDTTHNLNKISAAVKVPKTHQAVATEKQVLQNSL
jgi:hypothetical protein